MIKTPNEIFDSIAKNEVLYNSLWIEVSVLLKYIDANGWYVNWDDQDVVILPKKFVDDLKNDKKT